LGAQAFNVAAGSTVAEASGILQLGEEEVRYCNDLIKLCKSPGGMPPFLKKRRQTSRALSLMSDYCGPIQSQEEKDLFLSLLPDHTKGTNTNWAALLLAYNRSVVASWKEKSSFGALLLTEEKHLRKYATVLLAQAGSHEVARLDVIVQGIADGGALPARPVALVAPQMPDVSFFGRADRNTISRGQGGLGGGKYCTPCQDQIRARYNRPIKVPFRAHQCPLALIYAGIPPSQILESKGYNAAVHSQMSREMALQKLEDLFVASVRKSDRKESLKRVRGG
jgi:hypothetical protein